MGKERARQNLRALLWFIINGAVSEFYHGTDRFSFVHQVKAVVDFVQCNLVGDHRINLDLAVHIPVDKFRHIGAPLGPAEGGAFRRGQSLVEGRVEIQPCGATPMMTETPQPRCEHSSASRMTCTFPVASKE